MTELYIPAPKNLQEARTQANVAARAASLFTTDGYTWDRIEGPAAGAWYKVTSPQGKVYTVDPLLSFRCSCQFGTDNGWCKHGIAVEELERLDAELEFEAAYQRNGGDDLNT